MFLLAIMGVDPCTKPGRTQKVVMCAHTTRLIEALRLFNSCIVHEHKIKDVQGQGPSQPRSQGFSLEGRRDGQHKS